MTRKIALTVLWSLLLASAMLAQTTTFSYQGSLQASGSPANGNYDFEFKLYDAIGGGVQQGATVQRLNVAVANGVFSVLLDFGSAALPGSDRYLEMAVRPAGGGGFTALSPRQMITSTPYSVRSLSAGTAATANALNCTGCVSASQISSVNGSSVSGTIPVASVPAGSANYIQNSTLEQSSSNFYISGDGSIGGTLTSRNINLVGPTPQFNVNGARLFGFLNTENTLFGFNGQSITTGSFNSFFGSSTGYFNTTGSFNSFVGASAGSANTTGGFNAFFGNLSGQNNSTGSQNVFIGVQAGHGNFTGSNNTAIGRWANFSSGDLTFATAVGSYSYATSSNQIQLGRNDGDTVRIGKLEVATATNLCINNNNVLSACTSSGQYKQNIHPLSTGLSLVQRLRPVTFTWKGRNELDLGLIAEDVASIEPLLVTHNRIGGVEGIKYDQLSVVLINAIKEQQSQIERQKRQISSLIASNATLSARLRVVERRSARKKGK